jgi:hypothetical protein
MLQRFGSPQFDPNRIGHWRLILITALHNWLASIVVLRHRITAMGYLVLIGTSIYPGKQLAVYSAVVYS